MPYTDDSTLSQRAYFHAVQLGIAGSVKGLLAPRFRTNRRSFSRVLLSTAAAEEQAAIVRFLDHVDRRIRRYIRAKQKLIKLLEEQKQAIIHRAVTRGLDPNVRLKPSGVEWLGDVPDIGIWQIAISRGVVTDGLRNFGGLQYRMARYSVPGLTMGKSKRVIVVTGSGSGDALRNVPCRSVPSKSTIWLITRTSGRPWLRRQSSCLFRRFCNDRLRSIISGDECRVRRLLIRVGSFHSH